MRIAIETYLKTAQEFILKDQREKGIYSSGESANSTRIEAKDNSGQLYGADYFTQQKQGRAPGKFPPIEAIIQWIKEKGIRQNLIFRHSNSCKKVMSKIGQMKDGYISV